MYTRRESEETRLAIAEKEFNRWLAEKQESKMKNNPTNSVLLDFLRQCFGFRYIKSYAELLNFANLLKEHGCKMPLDTSLEDYEKALKSAEWQSKLNNFSSVFGNEKPGIQTRITEEEWIANAIKHAQHIDAALENSKVNTQNTDRFGMFMHALNINYLKDEYYYFCKEIQKNNIPSYAPTLSVKQG